VRTHSPSLLWRRRSQGRGGGERAGILRAAHVPPCARGLCGHGMCRIGRDAACVLSGATQAARYLIEPVLIGDVPTSVPTGSMAWAPRGRTPANVCDVTSKPNQTLS